MPKATFTNLSLDKQRVIIDAACCEFANYPFERASLSNIVAQAGIAKGSMYQYFKDKRDLYLYVVRTAYAKKHEYLKDVFIDADDFFLTLQRYYKKSYLYAVENPLLHQITNNFWDSKDESLHQQICANKEIRALDFNRRLQLAIASGQVREDISHEAAFFVYHSVGKELIDNFLESTPQETQQHLAVVEAVLDILAEGLKVRRNNHEN